MLETHRLDVVIVKAVSALRHGGTASEIHDWIRCNRPDSVSIDTIKRHLPGLLGTGALTRRPGERDGKPVFIFEKSGERVSQALSASGSS